MAPFFRRDSRDSGPAGVKARRPHAGLLRREQRSLLRVRDEKLRDLGGLLVELYRRGGFREDLLAEGCAELIGIDARLAEIDELLHAERRVARCTCVAALLHGAHFCPNCGRTLIASTSEDTVIVKPEGLSG